MTSNTTVIIRYSGERTFHLCREIVLQQVPQGNLEVISERPFSKAVQRTFEVGIECGRPWTLAVDADVLLKPNCIKELVAMAETHGENVFVTQGLVLDKLTGNWRSGGPHLFRTSLLERALRYIPDERDTMRPESATYGIMRVLGFSYVHQKVRYGLHDFEQFYSDILRKIFVRSYKIDALMHRVESAWNKLALYDLDYRVAQLATHTSERLNIPFSLDPQAYSDITREILMTNGIIEKPEMTIGIEEVQELWTKLEQVQVISGFEEVYLTKETKTQKLLHKYGYIKIAPWLIGRFIEKIGSKIKDYAEHS